MRVAKRRALVVTAFGALLACPVRAGVQRIEPNPPLGEMGSDAVVTVMTDQGSPISGVVVRAVQSAGEEVELGSTDQQGGVRFTPPSPGSYEFRAVLPERQLTLIAPYEVLPEPRRWLWALVCVPVGLVLLWLNLRRSR